MTERTSERVEVDLGWAKLYVPVDYDLEKLPEIAEILETVRQHKLRQLTGQKIEQSARLEVEGE